MNLLVFFCLLIFMRSHANELRYCTESLPLLLNPQKASDSNTFYVTRSIYGRLVDFKRGGVDIEPSLAEKWTISPDNLTYTFFLRKNVSFHENIFFTPSRFFNADDVVFSFEKMRDTKHAFHSIGGGSYEYFEAMGLKENIQEIVRVDENTVRIILRQPNASFLSMLAMDFLSILSYEYALHLQKLKKAEHLDMYPIGTGPFFLESNTKDKEVVLKKFNKYWKKNIKLDRLVFAQIPLEEDRYKQIYANNCDITGSLNFERLREFRGKGSPASVLDKPGLNTSYLALNTQKKPLDNIKLREAISSALNRKKYLETVFLGQGLIAKNIIPPFILGYNEQVRDYSYNPEFAKKIIKEIGFENFELELWVLPISRTYLQDPATLAELIREDLKAIGLKIKLVTMDWAQYLLKTKRGEHQMALFGWVGDHSDPDNFFSVLLSCDSVESGSNRSRWCSKEFDDLILAARSNHNTKLRSDLYRKAQKVVRENIPHIPFTHAKQFRVILNRVQNYKIDPLGAENFEGVFIETQNKK